MIRFSAVVRAVSFVPLVGLAACSDADSADEGAAGPPAGDATVIDPAIGTTTPTGSEETVERPLEDGPDITPPEVTAVVEGNFGLVQLTAIASDDVRLDGVRFLIDGMATRRSAIPAFVASDPADQYLLLFDTTGLADGPHTLVARAEDRSRNVTDSAEVVFDVDASVGLIELAANESIATAPVVARSLRQIAGRIDNVRKLPEAIVTMDIDYYRISLDAGEELSVDMLSSQLDFFSLGVEDESGAQLSGDRVRVSSFVSRVGYTNGPEPRDVYVRVSSGPIDFETDNQYKLSLTYR